MTLLFISIALGVLLFAFAYVLVTPSIKTETFIVSKDSTLDPNLQKALNFLGGDISSAIPNKLKQKKRRNQKLNRLFITSGNPWNITLTEYFVIQVFLGLSGLILGGLASIVLMNRAPIALLTLGVIGLAILGYNYPTIYYKSVSEDRTKAFKYELPGAIDFLRIALSGGQTGLPQAITLTTKYLDDGVMKDEFTKITEALQSGKSLTVALDEFAKRAPTEGIQAFVKSLNNATQMSADVMEILKNRAEASRKELKAEVDKKIASLDVKILMVFGPMAYSSVLIVVLAPTATTLLNLLR